MHVLGKYDIVVFKLSKYGIDLMHNKKKLLKRSTMHPISSSLENKKGRQHKGHSSFTCLSRCQVQSFSYEPFSVSFFISNVLNMYDDQNFSERVLLKI